jgi:hypothetical protein
MPINHRRQSWMGNLGVARATLDFPMHARALWICRVCDLVMRTARRRDWPRRHNSDVRDWSCAVMGDAG